MCKPSPPLQTLATTVSSNLFAFSIIPYAGFLYYLTKSKAAPPLMLFGWYFLLAFVAVSIPAGIYGKLVQAGALVGCAYVTLLLSVQ